MPVLKSDRKGSPIANTPVAAGTYNTPNYARNVAFEHSGTIASHTINMPLYARDGQEVRFMFRSAITAVTHAAPGSGHTIRNGLTAATAGQVAAWIFDADDKIWRRSI